ncbi:MAG TPA: DUF2127 domain-containing protein [Verrucomicrobiae bacterium]|jgi:uncharacterized membrane protein|nr:DUF2127 domain-containing protein [Verrucomicrobiae bacterium]
MQANPVPHTAREKWFHRLFEIGIWIKGIDGLVEVIGGILLLSVSLEALNHYIIDLVQTEIEKDSGDLIVNVLQHAAEHLTKSSKLTAGIYLLGNGAVKLFLATCVLLRQLWCYPIAIVIMTIFILLQCGRLGFHFSWSMLIATIIDVGITLLIWREYRRLEAYKL